MDMLKSPSGCTTKEAVAELSCGHVVQVNDSFLQPCPCFPTLPFRMWSDSVRCASYCERSVFGFSSWPPLQGLSPTT